MELDPLSGTVLWQHCLQFHKNANYAHFIFSCSLKNCGLLLSHFIWLKIFNSAIKSTYSNIIIELNWIQDFFAVQCNCFASSNLCWYCPEEILNNLSIHFDAHFCSFCKSTTIILFGFFLLLLFLWFTLHQVWYAFRWFDVASWVLLLTFAVSASLLHISYSLNSFFA